MSGLGDYHKDMDEDTRPLPEPYTIGAHGTELEGMVSRELFDNNVLWDLSDLTALLLRLHQLGFNVKLVSGSDGSWLCYIKFGKYGTPILDHDERVVRDGATMSPAYAVARAAVAAVRYWPAERRAEC